jgi:ligand-binding sensor domain-containing protein
MVPISISDGIRSMIFDEHGSLWIGHSGGLQVMHRDTTAPTQVSRTRPTQSTSCRPLIRHDHSMMYVYEWVWYRLSEAQRLPMHQVRNCYFVFVFLFFCFFDFDPKSMTVNNP